MKEKRKVRNAVEILHRRYITSEERKASLKEERLNAEVARTIYDLRQEAGLSQKELAEKIGTTQSVISRLEDADYDGHSLSMLSRIAKALSCQVDVRMAKDDQKDEMIRYVFGAVMRGLRLEKGLSIDQLSKESDVDSKEITAIERYCTYRPSPLTLYKLSDYFGIPQRKFALLAGAIKNVPSEFKEQASRFAACSESFAKLSSEEKQTLDEFVKFLRVDVKEA